MPAMDAQPSVPRAEPGVLQRALRRLLMRRAVVSACEDLGERFRLITLEGGQLRAVQWLPGQKVQIAIGATFATRTYTPIDWDEAAGRTRILGYAHGDAPGSAWIRNATVGSQHDVFGPRRSLDAGRVVSPLVVFGDETSIGLAHALQSDVAGRSVSCRFESGHVDATARVVDRLGLVDVKLFGRTEGDDHLEEMEAGLPALAAAGATFVLTGKAPTIQRLRQFLRNLGVPGARVMTKAYWAPGKSGLD